jgi:hypothetical protein
MNHLAQVVGDPWFWLLVALYLIFMAAVGALPPPEATDGKGYRFLYQFLNTLSVNVHAIVGSRFPVVNNITSATNVQSSAPRQSASS